MKKIIQLLDTFRDAETIFLHIKFKKLAEYSDEELVEHYNKTFEVAISTSGNSLEDFRAQGYEFTRRFGLSPVAYPEEKVLQASGPIEWVGGKWTYQKADGPEAPPVIDRSPLIDGRPIREVAPPGFNHRLYWTIRYKSDPEFAHVRLKRLEKGYPKHDYPEEFTDIVGIEEFYADEPDRLPFFIGCQFGIYPYKQEHIEYLKGKTGTARVAILAKSVLSGYVSGLNIEEVEWGAEENQTRYRLWKKIREIRRFSNE
jgi:hypothetical protein